MKTYTVHSKSVVVVLSKLEAKAIYDRTRRRNEIKTSGEG